VPELAFAFNTSHGESTGYTPAYLNYGRELRPAGSLIQEAGKCAQTSAERRIAQLQDACELARTNLAKSFQRQRHYYNLRRREWTPAVGERVLKRMHELSDKASAFNAKLAPKFEGPPELCIESGHPLYSILKRIGINIILP